MFNTLIIIMAYLMGSISSAIIIARLLGKDDPRTVGSKNAGATNMLRSAGKKAAVAVMIFDIAKGLIPVLIAKTLGLSALVQSWVAFAAVAGHIFPVFFKFRGGKGVATALGGVFGLSFPVGVLVAIVWASMAKLYRYASLASIAAVTAAPLLILMFGAFDQFYALLLMAIVIIIKHHENIRRLSDGSEGKIGDKKD